MFSGNRSSWIHRSERYTWYVLRQSVILDPSFRTLYLVCSPTIGHLRSIIQNVIFGKISACRSSLIPH
jgi:hypothetical protein